MTQLKLEEDLHWADSMFHQKGGQAMPGRVPVLRSQADSPTGSEVKHL